MRIIHSLLRITGLIKGAAGDAIALPDQFLAEVCVGAMQTVLGNIVLEAQTVFGQGAI
jgi:hypothetical protein